jgi:hypothetical protein
MTFCTFAFASDGWVMAADRAELNTWGEGTSTREAAIKIHWDENAEVAAPQSLISVRPRSDMSLE